MSFFKKLFGGSKKPQLSEMSDAAFRDYVIATIKRHFPSTIARANPEDVRGIRFKTDDGEEAEMNLHNLIQHVRAYPEDDGEMEVEKFLNAMIFAQITERELNDSNIVVVLRPEDYVAHINSLNEDTGGFPSKLYLQDLHAVYMEDNPDAMRTLTYDDFGDRTLDDIHTLAVENVRPWLSNIVGQDAEGVFSMYTVEENTYLISSMVFLEEFWTLLENRHGKHFLFAIPRKDQFFVFSTKNPNAMEAATRMVQATWEDDFNLLSPLIYIRSGGANQVYKAS